jgi:hypothetical protein
MIKRRGKSQIENLTFDKKSFENRGQMNSDQGVLYIVEKTFLKTMKYSPCIFKIDLIWKKYECPKFWNNKNLNFGTLSWESQGKMIFGCSPCGEA